jgi:preprotein translocase subunit SecF
MKIGMDFKGGTSVQFDYQNGRPSIDVVKTEIDSLNFNPSIVGEYTLVPMGENGYSLTLRTISENERTELTAALKANVANPVEIKQFNSVGPVLGREARNKSLVSIVWLFFVSFCILLLHSEKYLTPFRHGSTESFQLLHFFTI